MQKKSQTANEKAQPPFYKYSFLEQYYIAFSIFHILKSSQHNFVIFYALGPWFSYWRKKIPTAFYK